MDVCLLVLMVDVHSVQCVMCIESILYMYIYNFAVLMIIHV
jgi:hypothetical protein